MKKFSFTNWKDSIWEKSGQVATSMYGERTTKRGRESLLIRVTLSATYSSVVIFRHYLYDVQIDCVIREYTDTMELVQGIKEYIDAKEKQKE